MYSPSILVNPDTNALENTKLFCCFVKTLQALEVGLISGAVVLKCERDIRTRASRPLVYTAFDLSNFMSDDQLSGGARHLPPSELMPEQVAGTA